MGDLLTFEERILDYFLICDILYDNYIDHKNLD